MDTLLGGSGGGKSLEFPGCNNIGRLDCTGEATILDPTIDKALTRKSRLSGDDGILLCI